MLENTVLEIYVIGSENTVLEIYANGKGKVKFFLEK